MKKLALFLLISFSLTQALPAAMSIAGADQVVLFTTDEEKNQEETGKDKDGKPIKLESYVHQHSLDGLADGNLPGHAPDEKLHPSPVADILIPPPNK